LKAGLGHVTAQTLRRSVATATAHAKLPVVVAAAITVSVEENKRAAFAALSSMERTGIEPVTSGLQSRRSPS
jgi:hypothetical protein